MARQSPKAKSARRAYERAAAEHPAGEGSRFKAIERVAEAGGARNPGAVAAAIGRKKYGAKRMAKMAQAGKK